ncbi:hypothetical protein [Motilibacter deserti]|uniref:Uncharacterized protein n=1 Tax=Motilibacter deserti TaxID=2714956 RepID=A0ABX0GYX8_9ACTN|nr:hypothetical protein [Motilibacter deserti]NHC14795.1 hypothetical protein [Motilibacter deserti]
MQGRTTDSVEGGLPRLRALIRDTIRLETYEPAGDPSAWDAAERRVFGG